MSEAVPDASADLIGGSDRVACCGFDFSVGGEVFVDVPGAAQCEFSPGSSHVFTVFAADSVLAPIQCEYYALEGLSQLMNTIKLVKKHINRSLEVEGVVLTMFDSRTNLSMQVVDEVKRFFAGKVHGAIIPRNVRLGEAPSHGLPITKYDAKCVGSEAYIALAEEILGYGEEEE